MRTWACMADRKMRPTSCMRRGQIEGKIFEIRARVRVCMRGPQGAVQGLHGLLGRGKPHPPTPTHPTPTPPHPGPVPSRPARPTPAESPRGVSRLDLPNGVGQRRHCAEDSLVDCGAQEKELAQAVQLACGARFGFWD